MAYLFDDLSKKTVYFWKLSLEVIKFKKRFSIWAVFESHCLRFCSHTQKHRAIFHTYIGVGSFIRTRASERNKFMAPFVDDEAAHWNKETDPILSESYLYFQLLTGIPISAHSVTAATLVYDICIPRVKKQNGDRSLSDVSFVQHGEIALNEHKFNQFGAV